MNYNETIDKQASLLPLSIKWWPKYFYHFTDINNAIGIIDKGWIYGRRAAVENNLMKTDNASSSVISISQSKIKEYARLYFRPRTPTQYHNEGYKPENIRDYEVNASCPVPVFFFLDSVTILNMEDVKFSSTSCAGTSCLNLLSGEADFETLPFDKIYHDRGFSPEERDIIVKSRHAEILRLGGFPIRDAIKGIVCRSMAEKQTLLYLLKSQYPQAYAMYRNKIKYSPELNLFFNNGIFIKTVDYVDNYISVIFNDVNKRYRRMKSHDSDIHIEAVVYYLNDEGYVIDDVYYSKQTCYANIPAINLIVEKPISKRAIVEITIDQNLMYKNILDMNTESLI